MSIPKRIRMYLDSQGIPSEWLKRMDAVQREYGDFANLAKPRVGRFSELRAAAAAEMRLVV